MNMKSIYTVLLLSVSYPMSAFATTHAQQMTGSLCQPAGNLYNQIYHIRSGDGAMYNRSTQTQVWTCPVIRDLMVGKANSFSASMKVKMFSSVNESGKVRCTYYSRTESGDMYDFLPMSESRYYTNGLWTLSNKYNHKLDTPTNGSIYARCLVPGKRYIDGKWVYAGIVTMYQKETN